MKWTPGGVSGDVEDRRGQGGGGGFRLGGGMGIGGTLIVLVLSLIFGRNLFTGSSTSSDQGAYDTTGGAPVQSSAAEDKEVQFVSFVLDDAQHTWEQLLPQQANVQYSHAKLVLFRDMTSSACGEAESATGPFYCPVDHKVYIDLGFYNELQDKFGASGDFAQAYVIAHELGHHVQFLLGTEQRVHEMQDRRPQQANALSVRLELQADCYAGIWANNTNQRQILEKGDIEEGLNAAASVGDDRLQKMAGRAVNPESFTHGSAAQRSQWFKRGFQSGRLDACDTFAQ